MREKKSLHCIPEGWKATKKSTKGQNRYDQYSGNNDLQPKHIDGACKKFRVVKAFSIRYIGYFILKSGVLDFPKLIWSTYMISNTHRKRW